MQNEPKSRAIFFAVITQSQRGIESDSFFEICFDMLVVMNRAAFLLRAEDNDTINNFYFL